FRDDLRLSDNPALPAAADLGRPLVCVFVHDQESEGIRPLGGAARWWLHGSLQQLSKALKARGGELLIFTGPRPVPSLRRRSARTITRAQFQTGRAGGCGIVIFKPFSLK